MACSSAISGWQSPVPVLFGPLHQVQLAVEGARLGRQCPETEVRSEVALHASCSICVGTIMTHICKQPENMRIAILRSSRAAVEL